MPVNRELRKSQLSLRYLLRFNRPLRRRYGKNITGTGYTTVNNYPDNIIKTRTALLYQQRSLAHLKSMSPYRERDHSDMASHEQTWKSSNIEDPRTGESLTFSGAIDRSSIPTYHPSDALYHSSRLPRPSFEGLAGAFPSVRWLQRSNTIHTCHNCSRNLFVGSFRNG